MRRSPRSPCRCRLLPTSTQRSARLREDVADERDAAVYVSSLDGTATVTRPRRGADEARGGAARERAAPARAQAAAGARRLGVSSQAEAASRSERRPRRRRQAASSSSPSSMPLVCSRPRRPAEPCTSAPAATSARCGRSPGRQLPRLRQRTAADRRLARRREPHGRRARRDQPWMPKATVAIEDRRFYQHGGVDPVGILRALSSRTCSAGHIVQGGSTITQELVRNLYLSREQTLQRKVVEACLAIKLARAWSKEQDPHRLPQRRLLRQPRLRDRGSGRDVLLRAGEPPDARAGGAPRRAAAGALLLRPAAQPGGRARPPRRGPAGVAKKRGHHRGAVRGRRPADRNLHLRPSPAYASREPYFVGYVENLLQQEYGATTVRAGGLKIYTTDPPAPAARRDGTRCRSAHGRHDPGRRDRLDRSRDRRDPRHGRRDSRRDRQRVQPRHHGRAPGRLDVQADRPRRRGRARD